MTKGKVGRSSRSVRDYTQVRDSARGEGKRMVEEKETRPKKSETSRFNYLIMRIYKTACPHLYRAGVGAWLVASFALTLARALWQVLHGRGSRQETAAGEA